MMKLPFLLGLLPLTLATSPCGTPPSKDHSTGSDRFTRAIIGGNNVTAEKWPWQVLLGVRFANGTVEPFCGGTIISDRWILTAAHCITGDLEIVNTRADMEFVVAVGVSRAKESSINFLDVVEVKPHLHFNGTAGYENDIGLLKLKTHLNSARSTPICLPNSRQSIPDDGQGVATGFGKANRRGTNETDFDGQLRETIVPIVKKDVCMKRYEEAMKNFKSMEKFENITDIFETHICAGSMGHGTYSGDSGGPLIMKASDGRWFQIGVISFAPKLDFIQQDLLPAGYTNVRKYCDWIKENTDGEATCQGEEATLEDFGIGV